MSEEINKYKEAKEKQLKNGAAKSEILFIPTLIYAALATLFLYKNFSGITMPLFAILSILFIRYIHQKLRPAAADKRGWYLFLLGAALLGFANAYTARNELIIYNNLMIFVLLVGYAMYVFMNQTGWTLTKYALTFAEALAGTLGTVPDFINDSAGAVKYNKSEKTKTLVYCIIGVTIFIPVGGILIALLSSADLIFQNLLDNIAEKLSLGTLFGIVIFFVVVLILVYSGIRNLDSGRVKEDTKDYRLLPIAVANTILILIDVLYITFSVIQIASVFLGRMQLPEGYTYAEYIHEGYYQLMTVCFLNLCIVLVTKGFFKNHISTKLLLTIVSICTYIMIASAAIRLYMYVQAYNLTTLRIEVAWSLVMIGICLAFITISIYIDRIQLMHLLTGTAVVGLFVLSMLRPDGLAADYNLSKGNSIDYQYMRELSADAAPYLAPYAKENAYIQDYFSDLDEELADYSGIRKFNFSRYIAGKYINTTN